MRNLKVMLLSLLCFIMQVFGTSVYAQKEVMMAYVNGGGQELWHSASNETLAQFEQKVAICHEDLKHFFFLKQLAPKTGVVVVRADYASGKMHGIHNTPRASKEIWIVFYGADEKRMLGVPTNFSYNYEEKSLYAPRVEISRVWFCSRMLHELGHVRYHVLLEAESATAAMWSHSWMSEEVATHEYERTALDHYTGGEYTRTLEGILDKYNPASLEELFKSIRREDLELLDSLFQKEVSTLERGIRGPAFLINLSTLLAKRLKQDPVSFYGEVSRFIRESQK